MFEQFKIRRVRLLGDQETGKTVLMKRLVGEYVYERYEQTKGLDYRFIWPGLPFRRGIQIWDTPGEEKLMSECIYDYLENLSLCVFIYDSKKSFDCLHEFDGIANELSNSKVKKLVIYNIKGEETDEYLEQQGQKFANSIGCDFAAFNIMQEDVDKLKNFIVGQLPPPEKYVCASPEHKHGINSEQKSPSNSKRILQGLALNGLSISLWYLLAAGALSAKVVGATAAITFAVIAWPVAVVAGVVGLALLTKGLFSCSSEPEDNEDYIYGCDHSM